VDPHGDPIPTLEGRLPPSDDIRLADMVVGEYARIVRVRDQSADRLRYLAGLGLTPGICVQIADSAPFDGPISLLVGDLTHALDRRLARTIEVMRIGYSTEQDD
jgi:DtxR family Mn-dependent transcriptional regulator